MFAYEGTVTKAHRLTGRDDVLSVVVATSEYHQEIVYVEAKPFIQKGIKVTFDGELLQHDQDLARIVQL